MKRISILLLALAFTTQSFALPSSSAKLISHKEWSTKNIKSIFTKNKNSQKSSAEIFSAPNLNEIIVSRSKILKTDIRPVGQLSEIQANTIVWILNRTSEPQTYTIKRGICAYHEGHGMSCSRSEEEYVVDPGPGFLNSDVMNYADIDFETQGEWQVVSAISVQNNNDTKAFEADDASVITVPAS